MGGDPGAAGKCGGARVNRRRSRRDLFTSWFATLREVGDAVRTTPRIDPSTALRPPGALTPDAAFLEACTGCGDCIPVCPGDSIVAAELGEGRSIPVIVPERRGCFLCTDLPCVAACPEGALVSPGKPERVRMGVARVNPKRCVTFRGRACDLCLKACPYPQQAIMMVGGRPIVASGVCTGCGLCEYACPESPKAIVVIPERDLVPGLRVPRNEFRAG